MLRTTAKCTVYGKLILDLNPDSRGAMTLTEYELERQERIRLNKAQMAAMGLAETVKEMEKTKDVHTIRANRPAKPPIRRVIAKSKNNNFVRRSVRCVPAFQHPPQLSKFYLSFICCAVLASFC